MAKFTSTSKKKNTQTNKNSIDNFISSMQGLVNSRASILDNVTNAVNKPATNTPSTNTPSTSTPSTGNSSSSTSKYDTSAYDDMIAAYESKLKADAETRKQKAEQEYNNQAKSAYVSKLQNERKLASNLAQAGIRGGATETANLKLASNYENTRNQINQNKANALSDIDTEMNDRLFEYQTTQEAAKLAYLQQREAEDRQIAETKRQEQWQAQQNQLAWDQQIAETIRQEQWQAQQNQLAWKQQLKENQRQEKLQAKQTAQANKEKRYAATISGWNTVSKIDKEIKKIRNSGKNLWKIQYLRAQRAVVQAKKNKE